MTDFSNIRSVAEILATRRFRTSFMQCLSRHPRTLRVVSPYVTALPGYGSIVNFARLLLREGETVFQLTTGPPGSSDTISFQQAEILERLGADILIRSSPFLHSKVYQFSFRQGDRTAFVGSANFTKGGFERNEESVAVFRKRLENDKVAAEIDRLTSWGSVPFVLWKTRRLQKKRRTR